MNNEVLIKFLICIISVGTRFFVVKQFLTQNNKYINKLHPILVKQEITNETNNRKPKAVFYLILL